MALQISLSTPSARCQPSLSSPSSKPISQSSLFSAPPARTRLKVASLRSKGNSNSFSTVKCSSLDATVTVGQVTEVHKDSFWPIVKAAGGKTVVLDMYTQWCGPCKVIAPKFQALSEKYLDVVFLKLDCNQENRPLVKELGIRVVPTFKILKDSKVVKEVTGAKFDDLVSAIETVRSS